MRYELSKRDMYELKNIAVKTRELALNKHNLASITSQVPFPRVSCFNPHVCLLAITGPEEAGFSRQHAS